jgi:hypothetical protein
MFLARESGWSHDALMNMPLRELHYWVVEAYKLHNDLHKHE